MSEDRDRFVISKEEIQNHYDIVASLADEGFEYTKARMREQQGDSDLHIRLAASPQEEDRKKAVEMRRQARLDKQDLWREFQIISFLKGQPCAPGSEFPTYSWLTAEREYWNGRLANNKPVTEYDAYGGNEKVVPIEEIKNRATAVSSCMVDMERRFPVGIPTFRKIDSFISSGAIQIATGVAVDQFSTAAKNVAAIFQDGR